MPNKQRPVSLPEAVWAEIDELATTTASELSRECLLRGLRAYKKECAEAMKLDNARMVNRKLHAREGVIRTAAEALRDHNNGTKELGRVEVAAAIEKLFESLSD